jgi:hypothetical protein
VEIIDLLSSASDDDEEEKKEEFGYRLCGQCALRHEVIDTMYL